MSAVHRSALMHPFGLSSKVKLKADRIPVWNLQFAHVLVFEGQPPVPHRVVDDPNGPTANGVSADQRSLANLVVPREGTQVAHDWNAIDFDEIALATAPAVRFQ